MRAQCNVYVYMTSEEKHCKFRRKASFGEHSPPLSSHTGSHWVGKGMNACVRAEKGVMLHQTRYNPRPVAP